MTAANLFGDQPATPPPAPPRRGRGATAVVEFPWRTAVPNVVGRSLLTFRFRPVRAWLAARPAEPLPIQSAQLQAFFAELAGRGIPPESYCALAAVCTLYYFGRVGGLRLADDATLRAWVEFLHAATIKEAFRAIDEKARSLLGDEVEDAATKRRKYLGAADWFPTAALKHWIERHPDTQAESKQADRRAADLTLKERLDTIQRDRDLPRTATPLLAPRPASPTAAPTAADLDARRAAFRDELARSAAEREAADAAFWDSLSEDQQRRAQAATARDAERQAENSGRPLPPEVRHALALHWARQKWPPGGAS